MTISMRAKTNGRFAVGNARWQAAAVALVIPLVIPLVWVADAGSAGAAVLTGTSIPVAGVPAFGVGAGQLGSPGNIVLDGRGDVFVVDVANSRVLEYLYDAGTSSYGKLGTTVAGAAGSGAGASQLSYPSQVALDSKGDLFVVDGGNSRVQEYPFNTTSGSYAATGSTVAGSGGRGAAASQLSGPAGVALDARGDLLIADTGNNRVQEYAMNTSTGSYAAAATTVAGVGAPGSALNPFNAPTGLAIDANGDLFVLDSMNFRVLEYGYTVATAGFAASPVVAASGLSAPMQAIAIAPNGDLFVATSFLGYGSVWDYAVNTATGAFTGTAVSVGGAAVVGPAGVAFDSRGNLFISDTSQTSNPNNTVWNMVMELTYSATANTYTAQGTVLGQLGRVNSGIAALALDGQGNLFVADTINSTGIERFSFDANTGRYSPLGTSIANISSALAVDSAGDVFVGAPGGAAGVLEYSRNAITGGYPATGNPPVGATQLSQLVVRALALDSRNDLFAAAGNQVLEFTYNAVTGSYPATGTVVAGAGGTGSGPGQLAGAGALALDTSGNLFVADAPNARVQEYLLNSATGAYASNAISVAGTGGNGAGLNQFAASGAQGGGISGIALDGSGDLFAFDSGNARVMEYTGNAGTGTYNATGAVVASESRNNWPEQGGVAVDKAGDLFYSSNLTSAVVYELTAANTSPAPTPSVSGLSPSTGPVTGGTTVTITGANLSGGSVAFGSVPATAVSCTAAACAATSPAGSGIVTVTVTTRAGISPASSAAQFTYQASTPPAASLVPNPGFESSGLPVDYWGGGVTRSGAVVHSGSFALVQTAGSTSGGWDLDSNTAWSTPISSTKSYTATIWVRATAAIKVNINVDLLDAAHSYIESADGSTVSLAANTWTQLKMTFRPLTSETDARMEPNFAKAVKSTTIYWDDMSITAP